MYFLLLMLLTFIDESSVVDKNEDKNDIRWDKYMHPFTIVERSNKWYIASSFNETVKPDDQIVSVNGKSITSSVDIVELFNEILTTADDDENFEQYEMRVKRLKDTKGRKYDYITLKIKPETAFDVIMKEFKETRDDINNLTVYHYKTLPSQSTIIFPTVIAMDSGEVIPRIEVIYVADDWIFMNSIIFKQGEQRYDVSLSNVKTKILNGGRIMESDVFVGANCDTIFDMVERPDKILIRLSGRQTFADHSLSADEIAIFKATNILYKFVKQKHRSK